MSGQADLKKKQVAEKAVEYIEDGMLIGLGSGSTIYWMMRKLGERIQGGLKVKGIPSSKRTEKWAEEFGIPLTTFSEVQQLDLAIDGADEVDPDLNLIKGGGGSLLREKMVDDVSTRLIIVVDDSKLVSQLGKFPLPVEVVPFGWETTAQRIAALGITPRLRSNEDGVFISNNGNYILDCPFERMEDPNALHQQLKGMLGVVETGLFLNMTDVVLVGRGDGVQVIDKKRRHSFFE